MTWGAREQEAFAAIARELATANPPRAKHRPCAEWSAENMRFLRENYARMSFGEMAKALGKTRNAVAGKAFRLGLCAAIGGPGGQIPIVDGVMLAPAYRAGATLREIAKAKGVSYATVRRALRRAGVTMRPKCRTPKQGAAR